MSSLDWGHYPPQVITFSLLVTPQVITVMTCLDPHVPPPKSCLIGTLGMHVHAMRAPARSCGPLLPLGVVGLVKESCFAPRAHVAYSYNYIINHRPELIMLTKTACGKRAHLQRAGAFPAVIFQPKMQCFMPRRHTMATYGHQGRSPRPPSTGEDR